ncbi:prenyltransferase [Companilactobacillus alimentarius]|uniref:prenyltransferase n=1 Tax=Companilactobacillus alimentarius TaxID=1602 RepID=UPI0028B80169|nr:prenyltransferase [Companilactobacillus alimentarius]MDT6951166.1 prenyltransferase [Companilactobacillus alimentarius]
MDRKLFSELSEIKTTTLDIAWLILAIVFTYLNYETFNLIYGLLGFVAVFFIHLFINFHNNYMDYRNSTSEEYRKKISTIGINRESLAIVKKWMYGLAIFPLIIGAFLVYKTGWITLVLGIIGIDVGLLYSAGPKPLNSTMFGEIVVAVAITQLIPVTYVYLGLVGVGKFDSSTAISIILVSLPNTFAAFCAELSNGTCDLEADVKNGRNTLVSRIGKTNALSLFKASWALAFLLIPILAILKVVPYITLLLVLLYPNIWDDLRPYLKEQIKTKTYPLVIKAVTKLVVGYILLIAVGAIIKMIMSLIVTAH